MSISTSNDQNIVFGTFLSPFSTDLPNNFSQPKSLFKSTSLSGILGRLNIKSVEIKCADSNEPTEDQIQRYWD